MIHRGDDGVEICQVPGALSERRSEMGEMVDKMLAKVAKVAKEREDTHWIERLCIENSLKDIGYTVPFKRYDPTFLPKA